VADVPDAEKEKQAFVQTFAKVPRRNALRWSDGDDPLDPLRSGWFWPRPDKLCRWWWRTAPADTVSWGEMQKALDAVVKAKIDPRWSALGYMWSQYNAAVAMTAQWRDYYERVEAEIKGLIRDIPADDSRVAELRPRVLFGVLFEEFRLKKLLRKWQEEFQPYVKRAVALRPPNNRRTLAPRLAALSIGKVWGWKPAEIAGVLVLTGAEKMTADRDFKTIKEEIRKACDRFSRAAKQSRR
jgi:hypothetical protein